MKKHILNKPVLRDLFWFIVLPYKARQYLDGKPTEGGE